MNCTSDSIETTPFIIPISKNPVKTTIISKIVITKRIIASPNMDFDMSFFCVKISSIGWMRST